MPTKLKEKRVEKFKPFSVHQRNDFAVGFIKKSQAVCVSGFDTYLLQHHSFGDWIMKAKAKYKYLTIADFTVVIQTSQAIFILY